MAQDSLKVLDHVPALEAAFVGHIGNQSLIAQARIIQGSHKVGRKSYTGFQDWLEFTTKTAAEINERLRSAEGDATLCLDSLEKGRDLLDKIKDKYVPIAKYGIPEIDGKDGIPGTPMLRHRLVVIVGPENIGKSMFAKDQAVNVLLSGKRVVYMCGENAKDKLFCEIIINYVWKRFGYYLTSEHVSNIDVCPDNIKKIINMALTEVIESGNLVLRDSYSYDSLYTEMQSDYEEHHSDVFFIDHSFALTGGFSGDNGKRNIDDLARDTKEFRKNYPVCVVVLSHPSIGAKESIERDRSIEGSPTKGSQNLSTDADDVYVLRDNPTLRKEGLVSIENTKRRDVSRVMNNIILKKKFEVSHFVYDEKFQATSTALSAGADDALRKIESLYEVDNDQYVL